MAEQAKNPVVTMSTSMGDIRIELDADKAPISTQNFLDYVNEGHFDGLIFHRVIPGFMIQGGGFDSAMSQKKSKSPIKNEASNGLKNVTGSIAMARTNVVDSATAQFYINVADNSGSLDKPRYCVFGKVVEGMDVVNQIKAVKTASRGGHDDVPVQDVVIQSVRRA